MVWSDRVTHADRGDLIQLAAPDASSKRLKKEYGMSNVQEALQPTGTEIESVLCATNSYIETLTIKTIEAQPWLVELAIKTQLLSAKNPEEKRVKSRTCIERARLAEIQDAIGKFLQRPSSEDEPLAL